MTIMDNQDRILMLELKAAFNEEREAERIADAARFRQLQLTRDLHRRKVPMTRVAHLLAPDVGEGRDPKTCQRLAARLRKRLSRVTRSLTDRREEPADQVALSNTIDSSSTSKENEMAKRIVHTKTVEVWEEKAGEVDGINEDLGALDDDADEDDVYEEEGDDLDADEGDEQDEPDEKKVAKPAVKKVSRKR